MKKLILLLLVMGSLMIIYSSCQKDNVRSNLNAVNIQSSSFIDEINNYKPETDQIAPLFLNYQNRIQAIQNKNQKLLKGDPELSDTTIDVGMWLLETVLNNEFGFKNDSIVYERQNERNYNLDIIDYDEHNVPVVSGEELYLIYVDMEHYIEENALVDTLFWMCVIELESVRENDLTISVLPFSGRIKHLNGVLPPGTDPQPFPSGTVLESCNWHDYGVPPLYLAIQWRISGGPCLPPPQYIFIYLDQVHRSYTDNPYDPDERFWAGTSGHELVYTNECNYYLFAQKEIVDEINPQPEYPNIIIGTFEMGYAESETPWHGMTFWHWSTSYIYEKVFVGPGTP